jgi:hypothetical protein
MPALTSAGSDSDFSQLSGHFHGGQSLFFESSLLLICTFTAAFAALYLIQKLLLPRSSPPYSGDYISGNSFPPRGSASWVSSDSKPYLTSTRAGARQGQGHFEKQASWAISRGEASGTAPVGLGGPVEGSSSRSMEQEEKTTHTGRKWSRGVSNDSSYGTEQESSGLPHLDLPPFPTAAEESGHARASSSLHHPPPLGGVADEFAGFTEQEKNSMDDDLIASHRGYGGFITTSHSRDPSFSHPYGVADDLGVTYYPDGGVNALSVVERGTSTPQHLWSGSTRQSQPRSMTSRRITSPSRRGRQTSSRSHMSSARHGQSTPAELEAVAIDPSGSGYYPEQTPGYTMEGRSPVTGEFGSRHSYLATGPSRQRSIARDIPIAEGADGFSSTGPLDGYLDPSPTANSSFSPSSYPPASPLLPPPPITDYPFDPSAVMFPGPGAVDGGVRVVYEDHDHDHGHGLGHGHENFGRGEATVDASSQAVGSIWTRHTRVYGGGGVCLACAAAGGGGFYGARVRPEDKR